MTQQETKAVDEAADAQANKLRLYTSKYDFSRGFIAGAQFLDELRKVSKPDKELLEALKHAKSLISLSSISDDALINRAISNYEKTDQMTYSDYVRKDLAFEFAIRFYQLITSARVDEYIGARKDVCVNDLFEDFIKSKEDENTRH